MTLKLTDEEMKVLKKLEDNFFFIGQHTSENIVSIPFEQFREKKQPEDMKITLRNMKIKFTFNEEIGKEYYIIHKPVGFGISVLTPQEIYEMFFKAVEACKGTEHECKAIEKIADRILTRIVTNLNIDISAELYYGNVKEIIKIIESGGQE